MINFLKYKWIYFLISFIIISIGLFSIFKWGYYYSIDFIGGTNLDYRSKKDINQEELKKILRKEKIDFNYLNVNKKNISIKTKPLDDKRIEKLKKTLEKKLNTNLTLIKSETVGPTLSVENLRKTIFACILAIFGILLYMSFAFKGFNYALSAVLAMIHDLLVILGSYSLLSYFFRAEFDTLFITAILTAMSFSVHDTIVIFNKIREYVKNEGKQDIEYFANKALIETMVRSLNNSMTIIFMLLALVLLGGSTIRFFALALLIGIVTGTYSSPFVATPILVWLEKKRK